MPGRLTFRVDLSDRAGLASSLSTFLGQSACVVEDAQFPGVLALVEVVLLLPDGSEMRLRGQALRQLGPRRFLVAFEERPDTDRLSALAKPGTTSGASKVPPDRPSEPAVPPPEQAPESLLDQLLDWDGLQSSGPAVPWDAGGQEAAREPVGVAPPGRPGPDPVDPERMTLAQKLALARSGDREARGRLVRDRNRSVQSQVLENSGITIDEVAEYAALPTLDPYTVATIALNRSWLASREVLLNVVANPATPLDLAIRLLGRLGPSQLRRVAQSRTLRAPLTRRVHELLDEPQ